MKHCIYNFCLVFWMCVSQVLFAQNIDGNIHLDMENDPALQPVDMNIVSIVPPASAGNVALNANIDITFDQNIDGATLNDSAVIIRGSHSGILGAVYSGAGGTTVTINPDIDFRLGEVISVTITTALRSTTAMGLSRGHTYSFTAISGPAPAMPISLAQRTVSGASTGEDIKALDFDGDGDLDILTANEGIPEQIVLFENDGNMGFCGATLGANFRNVEVYDIDGDGDYDAFGATGSFDTELNWFENEGTFPFTERFISAEDPWTLAGGDLDSDGDIDVIAAVILPNRVLWFRNDGRGNFSSAISIPTTFGGGSDSYFYVRDINSDGAMDILAFHRDDRNLVWYQNDGSENFTEILIANTTDRSRLASGDIDGDGDIDIVAVSVENSPGSFISWFENDGSENFTEHPIAVSTMGRIQSACVTDLDGDLDMDILAGGYRFENDGAQNFTQIAISNGLKLGTNFFANGISYGDLDADGDMDILTLGLYAVSWQENGVFMNVNETQPMNAAGSVAADANISLVFDQPIDMATVNSSSVRIISQHRGLVAGSFGSNGPNTVTFDPANDFLPGDIIEVSINEKVLSTAARSLAITYGFSFQIKASPVMQTQFTPRSVITHGSNASGMAVADIDGDGDLDLVSCSFSEIYWHENDGSGNFTSLPIATTGAPVGVFALDHNEDGFMDIVADNDGSAASTLYLNDGSQGFTEVTLIGSGELTQFTDVNHDGDTDIVFLSYIRDYVAWIDSKCGGYSGFGNIADIASRGVQAGDMDNDGDTDFIAASTLGPVYYQNEGYFIYSNMSIDGNSTVDQYLADLDGDGDLDPIFCENFSALIWYENRLTGDSLDFGPRQQIAPLNMDPRDVIAVDIDGDGDADIAAVSRNDDKVVWYENRLNEPSADFGPQQLGVSTADGPIKILSADLDGNGAMDLITLSDGDDELMWFENTGAVIGIDDDEAVLPQVLQLYQNYPNPFNPSTNIRFDLPGATHVVLKVYNLLGQEVAVLENGRKVSGQHAVQFHAGALPSGIYYYRLKTDQTVLTRKMLLIQ